MKVTREKDGTVVINGEGLAIYGKGDNLIELCEGVAAINFELHPNTTKDKRAMDYIEG